MTPTDALIEKMARAHYEWGRLRGWAATPWDHMREHHRARYVEQMRAAYEAEHEGDAVLRDAIAGGLGMVRVTANADGEIVSERAPPEEFRQGRKGPHDDHG